MGMAQKKGTLNLVLAALIVVVAFYMLYRAAMAFGWW
jgi:hypothetical protein